MRKKKINKPFLYTLIALAIMFVFVGGFYISRSFIETTVWSNESTEDNPAQGRISMDITDGNSGSEEIISEKNPDQESNSEEAFADGTGEEGDNPVGTSENQEGNATGSAGQTDNTEGQSSSGHEDWPDPVPDKDYSAIEHPVVMLDPGHGGIDNGCVSGDVLEKDVNYDITLKLKNLLVNRGYEVVLTRTEDVKVFLEERVQASFDCNADIFVSIHQNLYDGAEAESVNGIESYYNSYNSPKGSKRLANLIHSKVVANTEARDRGVQEVNDLVVVIKTTCPSILIETGFLSNTAERNRLLSEDYQEKIASGIADAIDEFFR